jgi:hypothetical protein
MPKKYGRLLTSGTEKTKNRIPHRIFATVTTAAAHKMGINIAWKEEMSGTYL